MLEFIRKGDWPDISGEIW